MLPDPSQLHGSVIPNLHQGMRNLRRLENTPSPLALFSEGMFRDPCERESLSPSPSCHPEEHSLLECDEGSRMAVIS